MALTIIYSNPGLPAQYVLDSDPTAFAWGGTNAEINSILYRTDNPNIYRKRGGVANDWQLLTSANPVAARNIETFGARTIVANGDSFLVPGTGDLASAADVYQYPSPVDANAFSLFVRHNAAAGNGNDVTYTMFLDGLPTLMTVTLPSNAVGQASDQIDAFPVAAGQRLSLRASANNIGNGALEVMASLLMF